MKRVSVAFLLRYDRRYKTFWQFCANSNNTSNEFRAKHIHTNTDTFRRIDYYWCAIVTAILRFVNCNTKQFQLMSSLWWLNRLFIRIRYCDTQKRFWFGDIFFLVVVNCEQLWFYAETNKMDQFDTQIRIMQQSNVMQETIQDLYRWEKEMKQKENLSHQTAVTCEVSFIDAN